MSSKLFFTLCSSPSILSCPVLRLFWFLFCNDLSSGTLLCSLCSWLFLGSGWDGKCPRATLGWWRWEGICWNAVLLQLRLVLGHRCLLESLGLELLGLLEKFKKRQPRVWPRWNQYNCMLQEIKPWTWPWKQSVFCTAVLNNKIFNLGWLNWLRN